MASQYQEELPKIEPIVRHFEVEVGYCTQCQRRIQGRHRLQSSDALGAAGAQLGPNVATLVVELHTELGMPLGKVARVLGTQFGLSVTEGGLVPSVAPHGRRGGARVCGSARANPSQSTGHAR